jgi:integrase
MALQLARDDALVSADIEGRPLYPEGVSRWFRADLGRCRSALGDETVPMIRLHDLRHTHATILLSAREPVHAVSRRLGHASPNVARPYTRMFSQVASGKPLTVSLH